MSENEMKTQIADVIVNLVEKTLAANEQQVDRFYTPRSDTSEFGTRDCLKKHQDVCLIEKVKSLLNKEENKKRKD